jgi:hypothetical protein
MSEQDSDVKSAVVTSAGPKPTALSTWSVSVANVAFTAHVMRLISVGGFSIATNPKGDFDLNPSTGEVAYTGSSSPIWVRVTVDYSYVTPVPPSQQNLAISIAKNRETTVYTKQKVASFVTGGQSVIRDGSITDVIQLKRGESIQLAGMYSSTSIIPFSNVSYTLTQAT